MPTQRFSSFAKKKQLIFYRILIVTEILSAKREVGKLI